MVLFRDVSFILLLVEGVVLLSTLFGISEGISEPSKEVRLLRLYPASYEDCLDACNYHKNCQRVVFNRYINVCELQETPESTQKQSRYGRIVVARKNIMKRKVDPSNTKKSSTVNTTACPLSAFAEHERLGNMNGAGDRTIVELGSNASSCNLATFLCDNSGEWVQIECRNSSRVKPQPQRSSSVTGQPRDCGDLFERGMVLTGIYKIFPDGQNAVKVYCDFNDLDGPWTVIQRRVDDTVNFNRMFQSYQEGFGDLSRNFWLGLDTISTITLLSEKTYSLKVVIVDVENDMTFAKYSGFKVMNESQGYMLNVEGYSGTAGDSLTYQNGLRFSTYDMDRDMNDGLSCAVTCSGAWWYKSCHKSNLNGQYGDKTYCRGIIWSSVTGFYRSAIFATMKIQT